MQQILREETTALVYLDELDVMWLASPGTLNIKLFCIFLFLLTKQTGKITVLDIISFRILTVISLPFSMRIRKMERF